MLQLHTPNLIPEWVPCPLCSGLDGLSKHLKDNGCPNCQDGRIRGETAVEMIRIFRHALDNWDRVPATLEPDDLRHCISQLESILDQA